jgi:hypothetical protein
MAAAEAWQDLGGVAMQDLGGVAMQFDDEELEIQVVGAGNQIISGKRMQRSPFISSLSC